jgi:GT2 family glycosyltransferase
MPILSVIVLTHNKKACTRAALESLLCTQGVGLEGIVVDNGSTDGTPALLEELAAAFHRRGATLLWQLNAANVGCSTGRNQGLEMARGEYCAFMDNDAMAVDPRWAARLIATLQEAPRAAIVGPKLLYPFPPHWIQCAGVGISKKGRVQFRGRGQPRERPEFNERRDVQCLISACFLFRRSLYGQIGGLDEAFNPIEFEDLDFCYRAREAGGRCIYEPAVEVHHWESITSEGTPKLPNKYLIIKHGMLFKKRWRHMFEKEDGPPDSECKWVPIRMPGPDGERKR